MTTKIQVNGLKLRGYHGVFPQERRIGNIFAYDVEVAVPWIAAADSDDISLTLSYADIVAVVREVNATPSQLLEHVAYRLHKALVAKFPQIAGGTVRVSKIKPPIASTELESAAVVIAW
ncbi:MAG: dihydroneopterin aldolase [Bacteroidales bacterium]|nr:dihydroneopterin aldolase [Bacteroidales bacterium]